MGLKGVKGQFELSFGMIFSIILIVVFIAVAIIAINSFLRVRCSADTGIFIQDLRQEVNRIWAGAGEESSKSFTINKCGIEYVCFYNPNLPKKGRYSDFSENFREVTGENVFNNLYFYPYGKTALSSTEIKHINNEALKNNPECFEIIDNKISIKLSKNLNESLVRVS